MSKLDEIGNLFKSTVKEHSPLILSSIAGLGTITTAYLAGKASFQAARVLDEYEELNGISDNRRERIIDRTKVVWKLYIPTAVSAASTIACIISANRIGVRKTLAAQTALTFTQQLYSDYRDKVIQEIGSKKEEVIRGKVAEERMALNPPPSADILVGTTSDVLCYEMLTGRYFTCNMEKLRKSQNDINMKLLSQDYATLTDFYWMIGLNQTAYSSDMGWKSDKQMALEFSTNISEDGRPCLVFDYNYTTSL